MFQRVFPAVVLTFFATIALGREWTDDTGGYHVEGELQAVEGSVVLLTKGDGQTLRVPLERLSEADRRFATTLLSLSIVEFADGHSVECMVLQSNAASLTVLYHFSVLRFSQSQVKSVKESASEIPRKGTLSPRIPDHKTIIVAAAVPSWSSEFRQIPATVIDNGVLRNVPYKSYRAGRDYEINIYGDPAAPAGFEIGVHRGLLADEAAKRNCIAFLCSLLGDPADRDAARGLPLQKGKTIRNGLTLEITPPGDPDAYGGWWISAYDENALNSERASDKEMKSITLAADSSKPKGTESTSSASADGLSSSSDEGWSDQDLRYARTPASGNSGTVYVRGYYRKNGTYVHSYARSAPRRR